MRVLLVDDDPHFRKLLEQNLRKAGFETLVTASGTEALSRLAEADLVVSDIHMPEMDGIALLGEVRRRDPEIPVVLVTAQATVETAIKAVKLGAYDYIRKPTDLEKLVHTVKNALAQRRLRQRVAQLEDALDERYSRRAIVGESAAMERVFASLEKVTGSGVPVLITGESGTGKEMLAKAIHFSGPRRGGPFVAVNCAAIPGGLMESELFGHEKGAFTGATSRRKGKFEQAGGGTLLLDELGELPLPLQAKLLRALQEKEIERVGGSGPIGVDVRVVAATNRDLSARVKEGSFREDLFYRLNVFPIQLPALRERREDIPLLARHFLEKFNREEGRAVREFTPTALDWLLSQPWPGNVRELENRVFRAGLLCEGERIDLPDLEEAGAVPGTASAAGTTTGAQVTPLASRPVLPSSEFGWEREEFPTMEEIERRAIARALEVTGGNASDAARVLGLGKATVYRKVKQYGLKLEAASA